MGQSLSDAFESFPDVESDIQGRSTLGEDQDASPVDPLVSKRLDCLERIQGSAFSGSASPARSGGDLEAVHQVERQHAERLPSAVGPVVGRGNGIEREATLQFSVGSLVTATTVEEEPQVPAVQGLVGDDGGVLVMTVLGVEQVELEVLPCEVVDLLAVEDDAQRPSPGLQVELLLEAVDSGLDTSPSSALLDEPFQADPGIEGNADGVFGPSCFQPGNHVPPKERTVHAEFQPVASAKAPVNLLQQLSQEAEGSLAVMDVAGAVLRANDLSGLRLVGGDRIVAGDLSVMRVEAATRPAHLLPGRDDRTVDVESQSPDSAANPVFTC